MGQGFEVRTAPIAFFFPSLPVVRRNAENRAGLNLYFLFSSGLWGRSPHSFLPSHFPIPCCSRNAVNRAGLNLCFVVTAEVLVRCLCFHFFTICRQHAVSDEIIGNAREPGQLRIDSNPRPVARVPCEQQGGKGRKEAMGASRPLRKRDAMKIIKHSGLLPVVRAGANNFCFYLEGKRKRMARLFASPNP